MKVFKYMTYRVVLTHEDVKERKLDIPEEYFDEFENAYVLSKHAAHKYNVLSDNELNVIYDSVDSGNELYEISFNHIKELTVKEIEGYVEKMKGIPHCWLANGAYNVKYMTQVIYELCDRDDRPYDENVVRNTIHRLSIARQSDYFA